MKASNIPALILSGGLSKRMGFPKLLLARNGVPVVKTMIGRLRNCGWQPVGIVISDLTLKSFIESHLPDVSIIVNPAPERGMISSLRLGLDWAGDDMKGLLALPIDHPLIAEETLSTLYSYVSSERVIIPTFNGRRGHPTWWGRAAWDRLKSSDADNGAREILKDGTVIIKEIPVNDSAVLLNVNTPEVAAEFNLTRY
ncbi:MAG: nucleotidyltransferase family protein [Candidatus Hatepunaea meridiana]|nr:nucleotidyltransferase family protein [Candidatus Hatepunaea meridiana]